MVHQYLVQRVYLRILSKYLRYLPADNGRKRRGPRSSVSSDAGLKHPMVVRSGAGVGAC